MKYILTFILGCFIGYQIFGYYYNPELTKNVGLAYHVCNDVNFRNQKLFERKKIEQACWDTAWKFGQGLK